MKPLADRFQPAAAFARSYRWPPFSLAACGLLVAGLVVFGFSPHGEVREITIKRAGLIPEARTFVDVPDLYVVFQLKNGLRVRTTTRENTPVGNGIAWQVGKGLSFSSIDEVLLYDEDMIGDDILDRVRISQQKAKGQNYEFELTCSTGLGRLFGLLMIALSAPYLAFVLLKFVRDQAV